MSGFQRPIPKRGVGDDVSGHAFAPNEDLEPAGDDDVEGHSHKRTDAEVTEDDTEGHFFASADAEAAEDDDVHGHVYVNEDGPKGGRTGF